MVLLKKVTKYFVIVAILFLLYLTTRSCDKQKPTQTITVEPKKTVTFETKIQTYSVKNKTDIPVEIKTGPTYVDTPIQITVERASPTIVVKLESKPVSFPFLIGGSVLYTNTFAVGLDLKVLQWKYVGVVVGIGYSDHVVSWAGLTTPIYRRLEGGVAISSKFGLLLRISF